MSKQKLYDDKLKPILLKLGDLCYQNDIPFVFGVQLDENRKEALETRITHIGFGSTIPEKDPSAIDPKILEVIDILENKDKLETSDTN